MLYFFAKKTLANFKKKVYFCIEIDCNFYLIVNYGN